MALNRREFAGAMVAATALPESERRNIAVIGGGVFGAWSALHLLQAGHRVTLLDEYGPASNRASSGGESRIIRCAYGPDEVYTRMAQRSLELWAAFFGPSERELLRRIGVLWMAMPGNTYAQQSRETLRKAGVRFRDVSADDLAREYPQIRAKPGAVAILEPQSGALMARQAVRAVVERFVASGGTYRQARAEQPSGKGRLSAIQTTEGETISGDAFVFACGPWLGKVFPSLLGNRIFVTRQEVVFFGIPAGESRFSPPKMPVWIDFSDDRGMYGFPDLDARGFKVAFDRHGPPFDPDRDDRFVRPEKIKEAGEYVGERFPELASSPIVESRVCQYENTSNGDFLIDRHPDFENVWIAGGGSGHGFKHGPAVGEYVTARVLGQATPPVQPRFSLTSKATQENRAVY